MLYDLDAHRRKGVLFALGLDHNVGRSAANDAEQRLPVPAVNACLERLRSKPPRRNPGMRAGAIQCA